MDWWSCTTAWRPCFGGHAKWFSSWKICTWRGLFRASYRYLCECIFEKLHDYIIYLFYVYARDWFSQVFEFISLFIDYNASLSGKQHPHHISFNEINFWPQNFVADIYMNSLCLCWLFYANAIAPAVFVYKLDFLSEAHAWYFTDIGARFCGDIMQRRRCERSKELTAKRERDDSDAKLKI